MPQLDLLCFFHEYIYVTLCFGWLYVRLAGRILPLYFFLFFTRSSVLNIFSNKYIQILNWYLVVDAWVVALLFSDFINKFSNVLSTYISKLYPICFNFVMSFELFSTYSLWLFNWSCTSLTSSSWSNSIINFIEN